MMRRYLVPIALGLAGMIAAHIIILLGFAAGVQYPLYFITYPAVYIATAYLLTRWRPEWWLSNAIGICVIPFLYWYSLIWTDGNFTLTKAVDFRDSSQMLLILPFTLIAATLVAFTEYRNKTQVSKITIEHT